jgi:hypothetical protein
MVQPDPSHESLLAVFGSLQEVEIPPIRRCLMSYTPHSAAVAAAFIEIDATINKRPQYDSSKSDVENWNAMVTKNKHCRGLLIRLVKQLDAENAGLRSTFGMPASGGRVVLFNGELLFDPDNASDDAMISRSIAVLDPDR